MFESTDLIVSAVSEREGCRFFLFVAVGEGEEEMGEKKEEDKRGVLSGAVSAWKGLTHGRWEVLRTWKRKRVKITLIRFKPSELT